MVFALSKVLWSLVNPGTILLLLLAATAGVAWTGRDRLARRMATVAAVVALGLATLPMGPALMVLLENRFPPTPLLPGQVDGVVVLGGVVDQFVTRARGRVAVGGSVERLLAMAELGARYPDAKLVFTGGSGSLLDQDIKEADVVAPLLEQLGLDLDRVTLESRSRNTYENATMTRDQVAPRPGETWVLVTSAFHMPRAMGCFRRAGWRPIAYPVDYVLEGDEATEPMFDLTRGLSSLNAAFHEWIGLVAYWLLDRTDALFPGPDRTGRRREYKAATSAGTTRG